MITKGPRGTKDVLPSEAYKWNYIENAAREVASGFGVGEIRTPIFEHTELFLRGVGETTDIVQKEMYTFMDKGDRSITLKPEGTAPAARSYIENNLGVDQQLKMFYITPCFRYERPQAGRLREFHQFGVEFFGAAGYSADAELISLAIAYLKKLGIDNLKVNINNLGCSECRKKYNDALKEYLRSNIDKLCTTCNDRFEKNPLRIIDCKNPDCKEVAKDVPLIIDYVCDECRDHFDGLKGELEALNVNYVVDPYIVRGLDYYTKTVFEIISENIGAQSTVCGGGRYDGLIEECGGKSTPAVGFAIGLERLILTLEAMNIEVPKPMGPALFISSLGDGAKIEASKIAFELRCSGISCERDLLGRSLKAQMKYANKLNSRYVIVLGEDELKQNKVNLKNMETGAEEEIQLSDIASIMKARI
ncbi:histidine--tRNA ligase [Clostridium cylindrosporum]|uniref:Histidine--tRNA ligase n=1 Tax=Clostridium cylindrosporum DSM 605 TaxID=1121307 RepID=A0A0J8D5Z3_CLOCY|nr:histidine--tRNA ligase [Clostridium cylindrosporum]KMT21277.1 histidine--tRNA ligase HisS [Clostridium cylindrosporum DSM 605]